ncbi:LamB/YcsF family protein (plasmid) [Coraliomargarita sp. W4R53]
MSAIDLNADLGETVNGAPTADDDAMFAVISSANIACGGHAGDASSMRESVARAARFGVAIGAHPSYIDPDHFGRRSLDIAPALLLRDLLAQLRALADAGASIRYVKPHGALYNRIVHDRTQAEVVASAVAEFAEGEVLPILGLGGEIAQAARSQGLPFVREAFLDRGYLADGTLVTRTAPGALLSDPALVAARAVRLAREGVVEAVDGTLVSADAVSLCVHGDSPAAVAMAHAVRAALDAEGLEVRAPW